MAEAGDEFEAFVEELLVVGLAVAIGVDEDADLVLRRAVIASRHQHPALAPGFGGQRSATVRIFRRLRDPHAAAFVPLHGDGLIDQGFGGRDAGLEAGLHLEGRDSLLRATGAADRVAHVYQVLLRAEFVDVGTTSGPGDTALDEGAVAGVSERGGVALQEDGGTEAAVLEDPGLRLDVVDRRLVGDFGDVLAVGADLGGEGRGEDVDLLVELEVENCVVRDVEGGGVLGERMGVGPDVKHHQGAEATALGRPAGAEGVAGPRSRGAGDGATEGDEGDPAIGKIGERRAVDDLVRRVILPMEQDHFILVVLRREQVARTVGFGHRGADGLEFFDQRFDGGVIVRNHGHLDRGGCEDCADEE